MTKAILPEFKAKQITKQVQEKLIQKHRSLFLDPDNKCLEQQEQVIRQEVKELLDQDDPALEDYIMDQLIGYKDLGPFFRDPEVTDILVNGPDQVYIEKNNRTIKTDIQFESADDIMKILQLAVQKAGRKIDYNNPLVDVRLPDGSRLNAVIVPNCPFPSISIRKFIQKSFIESELIEQGFISQEMAVFFEYAIKAGCNIVVSGATGSGKTTFLRYLCNYIPGDERIVTIEDTFELNLEGHVVPLQRSDRVDVGSLMVNALRMYPRRIILGEFRGEETFELLQAMGTGHMGSMTTGHANNGKHDLLQRLIRAMMKSGMSDEELMRHIISSIDLTIFIKKFKDGHWCVTEINEVIDDQGKPKFMEIFKFNRNTDRHECLNSLSNSLLERLQDELGEEKIPNIKAFSNLYPKKGVVAV